MLTAVSAGATNVIVESTDPVLVLSAIGRYGVHGMLLLPTGLDELVEVDEHDRHDLSTLRWVACGGDKVPLELHRRFEEILGWQVTEGIGMTECSHYASNPPFGEKRIGSVGRATGRREIRIVDHDGDDVRRRQDRRDRAAQPGADGPLLGQPRGRPRRRCGTGGCTPATSGGSTPTASSGSWGAARSSSSAPARTSSPRRWRRSSTATRRCTSPASSGCADPHLGERVEAYVSLVEGVDPAPTGDDLRAFVADRIASYKVPDHVIVLPTMPRNHTGKVDRHTLEQQIVEDVAGL